MSFFLNWLPIRPKPPMRSRTHTARLSLETLEERLVPAVTYHGGSVLPNVEVQGLYYGNEFNNNPALYTQAGQLENALQSIAHGPYLNMLGKAGYGVQAGSFDSGRIVLTDHGSVLNDSTIQNTLQGLIQNGSVQQPDANRLYVVFVGPNVEVVDDNSTDPNHPQTFDDTVHDWAGYHQAFAGTDAQGNAARIRYVVIPTPGGTVNNLYTAGLTSLSTFDEMTVALSHEVAEGVTNPDGTGGWYDDAPGKGEIGDIANGNTVRLNGYLVQRMVDQADNLIFPADLQVTGTTINATAGAVFTGHVATAFDRDGTSQASNLKCTISWGDGTNSTGYVVYDPSGLFPVTGTHTYARAGSYQVTVVVGDVTNAGSVNTGYTLAHVRFDFRALVSEYYHDSWSSDSTRIVDKIQAVNTHYSGATAVATTVGIDPAVVSQLAVVSDPSAVVDPSAPLPSADLAVAASTPRRHRGGQFRPSDGRGRRSHSRGG